MVEITVRDGESIDRALKRFRKAVRNAEVMDDYEKSRFFMPKSEKRKHRRRKR